MNKTFVHAIFLAITCAYMNTVTAQIDTKNDPKNDPKYDVKVASNDDVRCKRNVTQYIEALQFVRQSAGEQLSAKVMSNYVPLEQLNQVVSSMGYCSGEQLLRDKKALR